MNDDKQLEHDRRQCQPRGVAIREEDKGHIIACFGNLSDTKRTSERFCWDQQQKIEIVETVFEADKMGRLGSLCKFDDDSSNLDMNLDENEETIEVSWTWVNCEGAIGRGGPINRHWTLHKAGTLSYDSLSTTLAAF